MSGISKIVGERIRHRRNHLGYSQEKLAEKCGLHPTYIGQLERGEKNPTIESIWKVVVALEMPLEELFGKLLLAHNVGNGASAKAYEIVDGLSPKEQEYMLQVMDAVMRFRSLN